MEQKILMSSCEKGMKECDITNDLLVEILVRLPLKSLCRFKCVSKSWYRLISDNYLRQRLPSIATGLYFRSESDQFNKARYAYTSSNGTIQDCNLDFFPFNEKSLVVDGSNGLLLYYASTSSTFYVVNTATKSWVSLPKSKKETHLSILAFDPYSSTDYKVVCFTAWRVRGAELEIYSSETGKWDQHDVEFGIEPDTMSTTKHYFDGRLYVLAYPNMLVAMNLMKFSCKLIRMPESINMLSCVGHCHGRLHYAHIDGNKLKIWVMNYLNRKWVLKNEINLGEIMGRRDYEINNPNQVNLLVFHPEEEMVSVWFHNWKMMWYDFKERRLIGSWKFEREKASVIQIWMFPCSNFFTNCIA